MDSGWNLVGHLVLDKFLETRNFVPESIVLNIVEGIVEGW